MSGTTIGSPTAGVAPVNAFNAMNLFLGGGGTVYIDAAQYMSSYGRHAVFLPTQIPRFLEEFQAASTNGVGGSFFEDQLANRNYRTDIEAPDYFDRAFVYGTAGYTLDGQFVSVNGEIRFRGYIKPNADNSDFELSGRGFLRK